MTTPLPFPGQRSGDQYASVAAGGSITFEASLDWVVHTITFRGAAAFTLSSLMTLTIEGQTYLAGQQFPISMLQDVQAANTQASAANGVVVWKPEMPIRFNKSFPITMTFAEATQVLLQTAPA